LLLVIGATGFAAYWIGAWAWDVAAEFSVAMGLFLAFPALLLAGFALSLLVACSTFFVAPDEGRDPFELRLPTKGMKGLLKLVRSVAEELSLPMPDEVRLHVESLAHVYEEGDPKARSRILVIGGAALASLDRKALSGVIAHELGHFAGGDTALSLQAFRWHRTMLGAELALIEMPWNPLGWFLRGYHLLFRMAWAANQRRQEYAADRYQVNLVGEKQTALTLIAITSIDEMPWSRLASVAEWFAVMRTRDASVFSEQVQRARQATPSQWEDACRRALKHKTGVFDTHPCLKDRLKAIGVSPKKAVGLAAKLQPGATDPSEFIDGWDAIDEAMSAFLVAIVQCIQQEKRDLAAIVLGRSVG
jgi:Zn-dependent protease with chaperone function